MNWENHRTEALRTPAVTSFRFELLRIHPHDVNQRKRCYILRLGTMDT
ncbi:hypothetical protein GDO86_008796 [Hymenochirus boettgeri]|uniref:Uncharacterized protein n=1 Tax=Hymenochirus boettgeri TaxID=247094 RepID=A0A8T2IZ40_9PIPI|nr:hypothetical protein GDO86_008796 [Hymenochirus boettgeri]